MRKISPPLGFDPRIVQPVASRYTEYATRPTQQCLKGKVHPCTGTEVVYRTYGHRGSRGIALLFHGHGTRRG